MHLSESHKIADNREAALRQAIPGADIVIHQDPASVVERRIDDVIGTGENGSSEGQA